METIVSERLFLRSLKRRINRKIRPKIKPKKIVYLVPKDKYSEIMLPCLKLLYLTISHPK